MSGIFFVSRDVFKNDILKREPFTEVMAWLWMVAEAAWKDRQREINGHVLNLKRGQFSHSIRFMANAWGWDKGRVSRFLARLSDSKTNWIVTKTETVSGTRQLVITICKYEDYQNPANIFGTADETATRQQRDSNETNQKQLKQNNKYIFNGKVIRLTPKDYQTWASAYHAIDLQSELQSLDDFYAANNVTDWFVRVSNALRKRHEAALRRARENDNWASGGWN